MKIPRSKLDRAFYATLIVKACIGVAEFIGGILLLFLRKPQLNHIRYVLNDLAVDNHHKDIPYHALSSYVSHLDGGMVRFAAIYLIVDALIKLALIYEVFHKRYWAYLALIVVLSILAVYQTYRIALTHSPFLIVLTLFDLVVIYLSAREYRRRTDVGLSPGTPST
jgi:uncharacterized membrane protein